MTILGHTEVTKWPFVALGLQFVVLMTKGTAAPRLTDEGAAIITNIITQEACTETLILYSNNDIIIAY